MTNEERKAAFEMRLDGLSWREIGERLHYDTRTVSRDIHAVIDPIPTQEKRHGQFICKSCQAVFNTPDEALEKAFGWDWKRHRSCPVCGGTDFEYARSCGNDGCDGVMRSSDYVCLSCRQSLFDQLRVFLDGLTHEELNQLDEWLDGHSIYQVRCRGGDAP